MTSYLLHLLRHGTPSMPGRLLGSTDCAATAAGIADCVAQVEGLAFQQLVSSDLIRCRDAAATIGEARIDPRWRELDFGEWDGLSAADVEPTAIGAFWDDPDANPPPGGERWSSVVRRIGEAIRELATVDTLVITHGGPMRAAMAHLCGFQQRDLWAFDLPYAALLSLRVWPGEQPTAQIVGLS